IPGLVAIFYAKSRRFAERYILRDSLEVLNFYVRNNPKIKNLPEAIAMCAEFRILRERDEKELKLISKLFIQLTEEEKMAKPAPQMRKTIENTPGAMKVLVLLHVHMNRMTNELTPGLKKDLEFILNNIPMLIEEMLKIAWGTLNLR